jgi:hypothetical protein
MTSPAVLRVVGVPEHFNLPWRSVGTVDGVRLEFLHAAGGTGAMIKALLTGDADVAVALTEGIVTAILQVCRRARAADTVHASTPPPLPRRTSLCPLRAGRLHRLRRRLVPRPRSCVSSASTSRPPCGG